MTDLSDEALMLMAQQGDRDAFASLVHRHVNTLYHYALRLSTSPPQAEDLVQDTWLSAWRHIQRYNGKKASLSTWLHRILHNKFIDTVRKNRLDFDNDITDQALDGYDALKVYEDHEKLQLLNRAIDKLPINQRACIVLTHQQGFSNREVAAIMGLKLRATESLLARARHALHAQLVPEDQNQSTQNGQ